MLEPRHRRLLERLAITFQTPQLLIQALTHRSANTRNNERLEFLGDAILSMVIAEQLYQRFPALKEGQLSRLRAVLVKGETLAEIARELDLGDLLILGPGELKSGGFRRDSILSDAFEALLGAYYLDAGYVPTCQLITQLFATRLDSLDPEQSQADPKTQLQEFLQARHLPLPRYEVSESMGKDQTPEFTVHCQVSLLDKPVQAQGSSRRRAEQQAAARVLKLLEVRV